MKHLLAVLVMGLAVAGVSGCGFQPVYGTGPTSGRATTDIGPVIVPEIPDRIGFFLRQSLERRFPSSAGSTANPRALTITLERSFIGIALQQDNVGVRTELRVVGTWKLSDALDPTRDISGITEVMVAYDQLDQPYGDIAAQSDAEERAAALLAERIWTEVLTKSRKAAAP